MIHPLDSVNTLRYISKLGGNLSDESLTSPTGPNDAAARGLMYTEARRAALEALSHEDTATKPTFTLSIWIERVPYYYSLSARDEHEYTLALPLGHPIPRAGDPFSLIPDGPIFTIEEVQWESSSTLTVTPTLVMRGEVGDEDWAKIKELRQAGGGK